MNSLASRLQQHWLPVAAIWMIVLLGAASCSDETGQSHTPTPTVDTGYGDALGDIGGDDIGSDIGPDVVEATCDDGIQNGTETDVDCGGEDCAPCGDGAGCSDGLDCESGACQQGQCVPAACTDGIQNGSETDVDCGGADCGACQTGAVCESESDCVSGLCEGGVCTIAECSAMTCLDEEACYRGNCYPACQASAECEAGSRCADGHCAPTSCNGIACEIGEACFQGVCYAVCEDGQPCPELNLVTENVEDLTAFSATFVGSILERPLDAPADHGFCWGSSDEPDDVSGTCISLGAVDLPGLFDSELEGLSPGQDYFVRAYATDGEGTVYANTVAFQTLAPAPVGVTASAGDHLEHVEVSWMATEGAQGYLLYRDGVEIAQLDDQQISFDDEDAIAASIPGQPVNLTASQGDHTDKVRLQWDVAGTADDAARHDYTVVARYSSVDSLASDAANGYRGAADIDHYELQIEGGSWIELGDVLEYDDLEAPAATIEGGEAEAGQGVYEDRVPLSLSGAVTVAGMDVGYRVRAVSALGTGAETDEVTGYRSAGELGFQWERSSGDDDSDYSALAGATTSDWDDATAPADGSARYYRVALTAQGAEGVHSLAARGFRAVEAIVTTSPVLAIDQTTASFNGAVVSLGIPAATEHGFCWGTVATPSTTSGALCSELGAPSQGDFSFDADGLMAGTQYFVRAYVINVAGTRYGQEVSFITLPAAVTGLVATDGDYDDRVDLSWDATQSATSYKVLRDGVLIATVEGTSHSDDGAQASPAPVAPSVTATQGDHSDRVSLSWDRPAGEAGATHTYTIVATNASGDAPASDSDDGHRGAYQPSGFEVSIADGSWMSVGDTTSYDDTSAPQATIMAGAASASDGTSTAHVALTASGASASEGSWVDYRVRALNTAGAGDASDTASGYRGVGALAYQWQRSAADSNGNYSDIGGATTTSYNDTGAPADGSGRYYRMVVSAAGAASMNSTADRGFRAALPTLVTNAATGVTATAATLHGQVTALGAPNPTAHGFCWGTTPGPQLGGTCHNLGPRANTGAFSHTQAGLLNGTTYYVRAYATTNAGTTYGNQVTFLTLPGAPTGLVATNGTSSEHVRVTWNAVQSATGYRVFRDNVLINTISQTTYDDAQAGTPGVPSTPVITASNGTHTDRVALSWTTSTAPNGATHTYHVVAVNGTGASASSNTDTGFRGPRPLTTYELRINNGNWFDAGLVTSYDDTFAPAPTVVSGTPSASQGTSTEHVALSLAGQSASAGATAQYRVRAINATGAAESNPDAGHRGVGPLTYQWQRSAADSNANYSNIGGATTASYNDTGAPADGSGRYYRVIVGAQGAGTATSSAVRGFRANILTFAYTGGVQTFTVPSQVFSITVEAYGAQGGNGAWGGFAAGARGGYVRATIPVTPGDLVRVYVGGQGGDFGAAGWNGGGQGIQGGSEPRERGGGGGASDIRIGGTGLNQRVLVAGGGGGSCGETGTGYGGGGGGLSGGNSATTLHYGHGLGGTQSAGGASGYSGTAGAFGLGGSPSSNTVSGGGGGWYGGGNGWGGGGGSSYTVPSAAGVQHQQGVRGGNGQVTILW